MNKALLSLLSLLDLVVAPRALSLASRAQASFSDLLLPTPPPRCPHSSRQQIETELCPLTLPRAILSICHHFLLFGMD